MTSTSGATLARRERSASAPFALAFGFALATSSAVGATPPAAPFTTTAVVQPSQAGGFGMLLNQTTSGLPVHGSPQGSEIPASLSQQIAELRALTGLTTDQVGRLFGVSRRSIHNWINGNTMALQHEERAAKILSIVHASPGASPPERRAALLDSSHGTSLFQQLVASRGEGVALQTAGVSVRERI